MSEESDARNITLNYDDGSMTMSVGNAKDIFGDDFDGLDPDPVEKTASVKKHDRVRVIGGDTQSIEPYTYTYKSWPTSNASNAAGGTVILMEWEGSDGAFTARVSGRISDAAQFFHDNATKTLVFRTERGTKYGPFAEASE